MLTDEEALRKAEDEYWMNGSPEFRTGFHAALEWLRSQGEPVMWMSRPGTVYGSHTIPLFLAPQPAVPDGWQLVPNEISGEQWSAMRDEFSKYATRFEMAKTMCDADAIADVAPAEIYRAALAAAPEPKSC